MNRKKLTIILFLTLALQIMVPGCAGKRPAKARKKDDKSLQTQMDILGDTKKTKLVETGITSEPKKKEPVREASEFLGEKEKTKEGLEAEKPEELMRVEPSKKPVPMPAFIEGPDTIEFNFENADLEQLTTQISSFFNVTFITDDAITPAPQGGRLVKGNKISFKTQSPLSRKEAWDLFITFLDLAGLAVVPESNPKFMRITSIDTARKSALQTYIGVPYDTIPDNDQLIRYVYFIENTSVDTIKNIVDPLRSTSSSLAILQELKAFIITDKAYNIRSLMNIVKELDKVTMPQAMSVLKLRRVDANDVKKLYDTLIGADDKSAAAARLFPQLRKQPSSQYFPENTRIIPEPRTNSLILLGPIDAIRRIENFITEYIDTPLDQPYSPLFVLPLRYADATTMANVMNEVSQFGKNTEAGKTGGVRNGDKYMRPILFTPEPETNRLVIKGDYEDYLRAKEIITKLDTPQPQVAIEVLLLALTTNALEQLGTVLRSRVPGTGTQFFGTQTVYQTTGLFNGQVQQGVVENNTGTGVMRLLGNLLNLVNGAAAGSTVISLGDSLNVWGILQVLQTVTTAQVVANPFLVATNKTKAQVVLGQINRAVTGLVIGTASQEVFGDIPARLEIHATPQINSDGMIIMDLEVLLQQFIGAYDPNNVERTEQRIKTTTVLADKEVLALGGLIRNEVDNTVSKVPILGDIPILGWLFKNRSQTEAKSNLLILVSTHIMRPDKETVARNFTADRAHEYHSTIELMGNSINHAHDPIDRWFFRAKNQKEETTNVENFIFRHEGEGTGTVGKATIIETPQNITSNSTTTSKNSSQRKDSSPAGKLAPHEDVIVTQRPKKSLVDLIEDSPKGTTT